MKNCVKALVQCTRRPAWIDAIHGWMKLVALTHVAPVVAGDAAKIPQCGAPSEKTELGMKTLQVDVMDAFRNGKQIAKPVGGLPI